MFLQKRKEMSRLSFVVLLILLVLGLDQGLKIWVKTHMEYGEEFNLLGLSWARIHFVENEGMAFGLKLDMTYGKLALSLFRIIVVSFLGYFIYELIRDKVSYGMLASISLILAGALGNILDSAFYGLIFSESSYHGGLAALFPEDGLSYGKDFPLGGFLHGKVVDMFYFPMFKGIFPDWVPIWGGESYLFFRPVFNLADAAITTGVVSILLWYRDLFKEAPKEEEPISVLEVGEES